MNFLGPADLNTTILSKHVVPDLSSFRSELYFYVKTEGSDYFSFFLPHQLFPLPSCFNNRPIASFVYSSDIFYGNFVSLDN